MKKTKIIILITLIMLIAIQMCNASVIHDIIITKKDTIPFDITTSEQNTIISIPIAEYKNIDISKITLNSEGQVLDNWIEGNKLKIKVKEGEYSNIPKKVIKSEKISLSNIETDEDKIKISKNLTKDNILQITDASGDFEINDINIINDQIIITPNRQKGSLINSGEYETNTMKFNVNTSNTNQTLTTESKTIPTNADIETIKIISRLTNGKAQINLEGRELSVTFKEGTPVKNEKATTTLHHGYQWIDRYTDGHFEKYYPNEKYWTPKKSYSEKEGQYIYDATKYSTTKEELGWKEYDYWEYEINDKRYNQNSGATEFIVNNNMKNTFNTQKFYIDINKNEILINCHGRASSIEQGYGIEFPKWSTENNETFFNPLTNKDEYYVKHFQFYYGPNIKLYAGNYTYPYNGGVEVQYTVDIPKRVYEGNVIYTYEEINKETGYNYNGTIEITYEQTKNIEDFPPSKPKSITINNTSISHAPSIDDYTPTEKLRYIYYYYKNNEWEKIGTNENGKTTYTWNPKSVGLSFDNLRIGVKAHDLYQEGPMGEYDVNNEIKITGNLQYNQLAIEEKQTIYAQTEAMPEVSTVTYSIKNETIEGNMTLQKKEHPKTWLYHINGERIGINKWVVIGLLKYPDGTEYGISTKSINKASTIRTPVKICDIGNSQKNIFYFFANDEENITDTSINLGKEFTIILPKLPTEQIGNNGYKAAELHTNCNNYVIRYMSKKVEEKVYTSATKYYWKPVSKYYVDVLSYISWRNAIPLERVEVPRGDVPIAITYKNNKATIYQDGQMIKTVELNNLIQEDFAIEYLAFANNSLKNFLNAKGKYLFSQKAWTIEQIENFINTPYQNNKWYAENGFYYGIPEYDNWLPSITNWLAEFTIPSKMKNGTYFTEITATNGMNKTIELPFNIYTPTETIGIIPKQMFIGNTYEIYATSSKYVEKVEVNILSNIYNMEFVELNSENKKVWKYTLLIPQNSIRGNHQAEFTGYIPSGENEANIQNFELLINTYIIGKNIQGKPLDNIKLTAQTFGYCKKTTVKILDNTYTMQPTKDINNYDNIWELQYQIPEETSIGEYPIIYETTNNDVISNSKKQLKVEKNNLKIEETKILRLIKENGEYKIEELIKCKTSDTADSEGFICKGHVLALKMKLNKKIEEIKTDIIGESSIKNIDKTTQIYTTFPTTMEKENDYYAFYYTIPYNTKQTLHSWDTLREKSKDGFNINTSLLLTRIKEPYILKITMKTKEEIIEKEIKIDIFDRWDNVLNRDITKYLYGGNNE